MTEQKHSLIKILKAGASLKLTVVCLLLSVILVIWGTLFQAGNGLYQAQQTFFHSWYFLALGFIPFPGTVLVMFVLFINLILALVYRVRFRIANLGNIITHLGIIVLLSGSFLTFYYSIESSLVLKEGETSNMSSSRSQWELVVSEVIGNKRNIYAMDAGGFQSGDTTSFDMNGRQLTLDIKSFFTNCKAYSSGGSGEAVVNGSGIKHLEPEAAAAEVTENTVGGIFKITSHPDTPTVILYGG